VLFNRDAGAEGATIVSGFKNDGREIAPVHAFIQGVADFAHHRDVEDIERRTREGDMRNAVFNLKSNVLKFHQPRSASRITTKI
jgi:hypothetical protein